MIEWFKSSNWITKLLAVLFFPMVVLFFMISGKGKQQHIIPGLEESNEEQERLQYLIEASEDNADQIDMDIIENDDNEQNAHNRIDTADSFDAVYKSIAG